MLYNKMEYVNKEIAEQAEIKLNLSEKMIQHRLYVDCWDGDDIREFIKRLKQFIDDVFQPSTFRGRIKMEIDKLAGDKLT